METEGEELEGMRTVRLRVPARPEYIALARLALSGLADIASLPDEQVADLKLALTEAVSNSVRHAYGGRRLRLRRVRARSRLTRRRGRRRRGGLRPGAAAAARGRGAHRGRSRHRDHPHDRRRVRDRLAAGRARLAASVREAAAPGRIVVVRSDNDSPQAPRRRQPRAGHVLRERRRARSAAAAGWSRRSPG